MGKIPETGEMFLISDNVGWGLFDTPNSAVMQDADGNGVISYQTPGERQSVSGALLQGATQAWRIVSVSPSGRTVKLSPVAKGTLKGRVQTFVGARPVAGATIQIWPGPFETTSGQDGSYSLEAYGAAPWKVLVKKEGYIPFVYYAGRGKDPASTPGISLRERSVTTFNFELGEGSSQTSGTVKLLPSGSFYAILGLAFSDQTVGDFSVNTYQQQDKEGKTVAGASACSQFEGQRGMVGLGDRGATPLDQITIPPIGYSNSCVQLNSGHVYIVKAREGLEGHFVVLRVDSITTDGATISYLYR
ncbi:MAG: carboxypeptidase regulatory-like domain-containing protein [Chloroflexi bacterium]|nr:carboxypeptidase regulatory-like domain-containing protein [Chloroflexota bacterium]